jgi:aminobenzoyl-glutamate utilization protein A
MNARETILSMAEEMLPEMILRRRDFHKHAESGWFEMRTSSIIARRLTELGYEVLVGEAVCDRDARMGVPSEERLEKHYQWAAEHDADPEFLPATRGGMTGVIGILECGEGPVLAMRFDIDALGVFEAEDSSHRPAAEGFASVNSGFMHACGHDGHAAIGLGVAKILMDMKQQLHGTIKLIFQPAEEGVRGALSIVENGHLDGVDFLLGNHISGRSEKTGNADVIPGMYESLATTKYDVLYKGEASHAGAKPHLGRNALLAASSAVLNLYAIPRHGEGASRVNVGTLHAGSGRNVIADEARMELEIRGANTKINDYMTEYATRILENCAAMYGCTCQIKLMGAAQALCSDKVLADRIADISTEAGLAPVEVSINCGSEDYSYMMNRVQEQGGQAVFFRSLTKVAGNAHSRYYDFDEQAIETAVKVFCCSALDILGK